MGSSPTICLCVSTPGQERDQIEWFGDRLGREQHAAMGGPRIVLGQSLRTGPGIGTRTEWTLCTVYSRHAGIRIDPTILAKENRQKSLVFRSAISFRQVWNRNYSGLVEITAPKTVGSKTGAAFYEETGARDMVGEPSALVVALTARSRQ